jgi:hypothetical protein
MLVDSYGSDNSDDSGDEHNLPPQPNKSTSLSLPLPSHTTKPGSSKLTLAAPKAKKAPKKIAIDLPALPKDDSADHDSDEARPAKKPRTETRGAGSSALFSRLPAPKLMAPVKPAPERILGSGKGHGLVFSNTPSQRTQDTSGTLADVDSQPNLDVAEEQSMSLPFTPVSVMKGKANVSLEESFSHGRVGVRDSATSAAVDLFSLSTSHHVPVHFTTPNISTQTLRSLLQPRPPPQKELLAH